MTFDCQKVNELLGDFLDGRLSGDALDAFNEHTSNCAGCREHIRFVEHESGDPAFSPPPDLTNMILENTSGSVCGSAHSKLVDHVDTQLEDVDDQILALHLEHCGDCDELVTILKRLPQDLPLLAEMEPDGHFVTDVLSETIHAQPRGRRWASILVDQWRGLLQRPRLAWEGAYLTTCLLILIMGGPNSALATLSSMTQEIRTIDTEELLDPVDRLEQGLVNGAGSAWKNTSGTVVNVWKNTTAELTTIAPSTVSNFREVTGTFLEQFASPQETQSTDPTAVDEDREQGDQE